jgi:regulator of sigma E protease
MPGRSGAARAPDEGSKSKHARASEAMADALIMLLKIIEVGIGVGLIIFVHELGHFLVAKKVGIRVETFSLGFGPRLLGFRRGDTDYRLSLIPLGGYVKMAGENPDEPHTGADDEFTSKTVGQRAAVISAGVIMNIIFAVIGFLVAFKIGVQLTVPVVGAVVPGSVAEGILERGDRIVQVGDVAPLDFVEVSLAAAFADDAGLDVVVERRGERKAFHLRPRKDLGADFQRIGIEPIEQVAAIEEGGAAAIAGLQVGDRVLGVDGDAIASLAELSREIYARPGEPLQLEVWRDGAVREVSLTPAKSPIRSFGVEVSELPVVRSVVDGAPAEAGGLREGDVIETINGEPASIGTVVARVKEIAASETPVISMRVRRATGGTADLELKPLAKSDGGPVIGASFSSGYVAAVAEGSPAAGAGIRAGHTLLRLGELRGVGAPGQLEQLASMQGGEPVEVVWRNESGAEAEAVIAAVVVEGRFFGDAGFEVAQASFTHVAPGIIEPIRLGFERTWLFLEQVFLTLGGMVAGRIEPSTLGGPILIGKHAYDVASRGLGVLLYFLCLISVNLAVINILPIPLLDGGHLVFLLVEKLKGSPVPEGVQAALQWAGLVLLLALMIYVTRNDILRLANG